MTLDLTSMWDFNNPAGSEARFRAALAGATPDETLILQTQIARTHGLRRRFDEARAILNGLEAQLPAASAEARARWQLELGRTYASATHPPEDQTPQALDAARTAFLKAFEIAQDGGLDHLAIDALHMMCMVDTDPALQVAWNRRAIELMQASRQPEAAKWAGSLHNNLGYALHLLGRYDEALAEFQLALAAHLQGGSPEAIRIAHWMVAWTLRAQKRLAEALEIQLRLEQECDQAGEPDPYVFEELELLYRALGQDERASHYAARRGAGA